METGGEKKNVFSELFCLKSPFIKLPFPLFCLPLPYSFFCSVSVLSALWHVLGLIRSVSDALCSAFGPAALACPASFLNRWF